MSGAAKFIEFTMPTPAELRESSLRWLAVCGPTLIDQWPDDVRKLSMATAFVPFDCALIDDLFEPKGDEPRAGLVDLANEIDRRIGWKRHFIRLNSRSPKDYPWPFEIPVTMSGKEAVCILGCSERMLDDLCYFKHVPEQPALVCLREWVPQIRSDGEFRCFVRDRKIVAVTHYDYHKPMTPPKDNGKAIRARIQEWFVNKLEPALHVEEVVFDIALVGSGILLIEINPYGLSDPCWFGDYKHVENAETFVQFAFAKTYFRLASPPPSPEVE